jgi:hypothetical protein
MLPDLHRPTVAILTHERQAFADAELGDSHYVLDDVAKVWRERGVRVDVLRGVPDGPPRHDVCIVHVDLTRVPEDYARFAAAHRVAMNGRAIDGSKRVVSRCLLSRADLRANAAVPVIVKTDRNYGGFGERLAGGPPSRARRLFRRWRARLPWWTQRELNTLRYRVYDRADRVPRAVWWNSALVVERFHAERRDGLYWLRTWVFLGDRGLLRFFASDEPVVKGEHIRVRTFEDPDDPAMLPEAVRARRDELGMDFGKIDYLCADDGVHVIDIARTPTTRLDGERCRWQAELLAGGLASLLGPAR